MLGLIAYFNMPTLALAVSGMFVITMLRLILRLYQTSAIIRGEETNYIMATVTFYVSIYNLFTSLLHLLGAASGDDGQANGPTGLPVYWPERRRALRLQRPGCYPLWPVDRLASEPVGLGPVITSLPAMYWRSASGTTMLPSAC